MSPSASIEETGNINCHVSPLNAGYCVFTSEVICEGFPSHMVAIKLISANVLVSTVCARAISEHATVATTASKSHFVNIPLESIAQRCQMGKEKLGIKGCSRAYQSCVAEAAGALVTAPTLDSRVPLK